MAMRSITPNSELAASQKLISRAALEIAKEQVSADYQKHAAAKKFAAEKEMMNYEKKQMEGQVAALRQRVSDIGMNLIKSENLARVMTDRCRTLEQARLNEETLRQQAEIRESNLFNLLVAEEAKCQQLEISIVEIEKDVSIKSRDSILVQRLEATISDLNAKLLATENVIKQPDPNVQSDELQMKIMELTVENKCLREDIARLQQRQAESSSYDSTPTTNAIIADFLERQKIITKEKEAIEAEARALSISNTSLKDRVIGLELVQGELSKQLQMLESQHGITVELTSLAADIGKRLSGVVPRSGDQDSQGSAGVGRSDGDLQLKLSQAQLKALEAHCTKLESEQIEWAETVRALKAQIDAASCELEKAGVAAEDAAAAAQQQTQVEAMLRNSLQNKEARIQALGSDAKSAAAEIAALRAKVDRLGADQSMVEEMGRRSALQTSEVEKLTTQQGLLTLQYEACAAELTETRARCDLLASLASKHSVGLAARTFEVEQARGAIVDLEARCAEVPGLIRQVARAVAGREEAVREGVERELARRDPESRAARASADAALVEQLSELTAAVNQERHLAACAAVSCRRAATEALEQVGDEVGDIAKEIASQLAALSTALRSLALSFLKSKLIVR